MATWGQTDMIAVPHIAVSGEAQVQVPPDQVVINFGIEQLDAKIDTARKATDAAAARIIALGETFKIAKSDMQTDYMGIEVARDWKDNRREVVTGYHARKSLAVTLRDLSQFEPFVAAAVAAGANTIHGVDFKTSELRKHRDQARDMALRAASEKAAALAKAAGMKLGKALTIREDAGRWWYPGSSWWGRSGGQMTQNSVPMSPEQVPETGTSTAIGRINVTASVAATYELLP